MTKQNYNLNYNGTSLNWAGYGNYPASSGAPAYQTPDKETVEELGPVPAGRYYVPLTLGGDAKATVVSTFPFKLEFDKEAAIQTMPRSVDIKGVPTDIETSAWGCHRVRLTLIGKYDNEKVKRPGGFYIHDSTKGYTAGCIETTELFFEQLIAFANQQQRPGGVDKLVLRIDYSGATTTNGKTYDKKLPPVGTPGNAERGF